MASRHSARSEARAGPLLVAAIGALAASDPRLLAAGTLIGFAGMLVDSALGSALQGRFFCSTCDESSEWPVHRCGSPTLRVGGLAWLNNDGVNLAMTVARRRPRRRGVAALGMMTLLLSACGADPVSPRPDEPGGTHTGTGSPGATITGTWQNVVIIQVPGDLQTWTTTWRFDADGSCLQTNVTESLAEGFPRTTERSCTYVILRNQDHHLLRHRR